MRTTLYPKSPSARVTFLSRFTFASILLRQNVLWVFGKWLLLQIRHSCQKHPSTNTATLYFGKTKSGCPPHQLGVAAPSGDSVFPKQRNKPKFRTFVSLRTDLGHHFRAFLLRHGIHFTISYETQQFAASNRGFDCYWKIGINPHFSVLSKIMEQCKFRRFACRPFLRHRQEPS